MPAIHHRFAIVNGHRLFYREAGPDGAPILVVLHGFPASSSMFRTLIPLLADRWHLIAPGSSGLRAVRRATGPGFRVHLRRAGRCHRMPVSASPPRRVGRGRYRALWRALRPTLRHHPRVPDGRRAVARALARRTGCRPCGGGCCRPCHRWVLVPIRSGSGRRRSVGSGLKADSLNAGHTAGDGECARQLTVVRAPDPAAPQRV